MVKKLKNISFLLLFSYLNGSFLSAPSNHVTVCSWNLKDFGKSKSDSTITFIANTVMDYDIVVIQEVVAGYGGPQTVARLSEQLNRKGYKWDYVISDPTVSSSYKTERYAFLWKTSRIKKIGKSWLEEKYKFEIDREPFYSTFSSNTKEFTLVNFHAITKSKQPETEVKYFKFLPDQYPHLNLLFCGDFNLPQNHTVFNPLKKMGFVPIFVNQKTSLKEKCKSTDCLASEFDNIFYIPKKIAKKYSGVIHFYKKYSDLTEARKISDHVPIFFEFSLN
ncbi:MAG: endonuclease [Chitinophagaceae bacterium]|nr:endonuclease [Chitinophagaceae bacterium]